MAKCVLVNLNIDPKKVAVIWDVDEKECWQYLDEYNHAVREIEHEYELTGVQDLVREYVNSIPNKNNIRIDAIREQLLDAKTNPDNHDVPKLLQEVKILKGTSERVTPQMIERAKGYPIDNLIELKKNTALCPFHNEKSPSFSVKNNKYKCFGCGVSGDSISLAMHTKNMTFKQAVEFLQ